MINVVWVWRNCTITSTEVSFQDICLIVPMQATNHHSRIGLIHRNTLESQSILVREVYAGISRWTGLWLVEA